jgi:bifunctional enzyme CysN/CysC
MIQGVAEVKTTAVSPDVVWEEWNIPREERELRNGHGAAVLWFTGLSGAGKTTIARELERTLFAAGIHSVLLDGDQLRHGLCGDLGFARRTGGRTSGGRERSPASSSRPVRSFLPPSSRPYRDDRERVRAMIPEGRFFEVHVDADLDTCRARDPKGLYARADAGEIPEFTGVSAPYEAPERPELALDTTRLSADDAVERILLTLQEVGVIPANLGRTEKDHGL